MSRGTDAAASTDVEEPTTGWKLIARNDSVVDVIDTLLDVPPRREFNKSELAEHADVSRKSVHSHIDLLVALEVLEEVPGTSPQRYRFDPQSPVSSALVRLDGAVNNAGPFSGE